MDWIPDAIFRPLRSDEVSRAHGVLVDAHTWLLAKGCPSTVACSIDEYVAHQERETNYVLESAGELAVVLTLSWERPARWGEQFMEPVYWLSRVATAPGFRGRGAGVQAVRKAMGHVFDQDIEQLCLDVPAGDAFLIEYFRGLGFREMARQDAQLPSGIVEMVLMDLSLLKVC